MLKTMKHQMRSKILFQSLRIKNCPMSRSEIQGDFPCKKGGEDPLSPWRFWKDYDLRENYRSDVRSVVSEAKICGQENIHLQYRIQSNCQLVCNLSLAISIHNPQSVWHLSSKGNCPDRLFIVLAIVKSAVS